MLVLVALAQHPERRLRFSELMNRVAGISQRMLTTTLRYPERDGILTRRLYPEVPPRVEYTLSERGSRLLVPVEAIVTWVQNEWPEIEESREQYDKGMEETRATRGSFSGTAIETEAALCTPQEKFSIRCRLESWGSLGTRRTASQATLRASG